MIYLQPKMTNNTFNTTNSTLHSLNKQLVSENETSSHESIMIILIFVISIFCVWCICRESESKQMFDLENKAIRAQNRIAIKTLN